MMRIWRAGVCNKSGFTLVELAMVMLVIGIVTAVAMPRVGGMLDRQNMRRTVNTVRGMVRFVQARAALTKRVYRLTFDFDRQTMSACYLLEDDCQIERSRELREFNFPLSARLLDVVNAEGEKMRQGEAVSHFYPTGLAEPSMIHLGDIGQDQMTIVIAPLGGRVKVFSGYVEPKAS
jgi:prepilin-type N-terminal cleavage/methylation domain-containing protein